MIILGTFFLGLFAFIAIIQRDFVLGAVDITILLFIVSLLCAIRKTKNHKLVGLVGTIATGLFYLFLISHGGIEKTSYIWALTYPLITLFLLGKRLGAYLSFSLLGLACIIFILAVKFNFIQQYTYSLVIRFIAAYITIFLMGLIMEVVREKVQYRLEASKSELEKAFNKVKKGAKKLTETNQQLLSEIVERKRIEKALRDSECFLDDIIESIQDGINVLDPDLTIRHTNSVMKQWYKENLPLVGKKCFKCYHNQDHPCEICPTIRCLQSGKAERDIVVGLPGSSVEWLELYSFPIKDKDTQKITGVVEFVRDITDQKRLENQLAHAQKMEAVGTLAGGVAHDLNNILSGIVSYPELLLMDLPEDSSMRSSLEIIQKSGQKAATIVQDLLTLSRRGVSISEVCNLNDIITNFLRSPECDGIIKYHPKVRFELNLQPDLSNIKGSPVHLSKTIMNLVSNAAEAITDGGSVFLSSRNQFIDKQIDGYEKIPEGEYVVITVTDTGSGISSNDMNKIFEPFYTKKTMGRSGTGLGMSVVWGTVKDLNGFMDVKSTPGKGSEFRLYLPITRQDFIQKEETVPKETYMGNKTILVVDDVEEQRVIASQMLKKIGYSVGTVSSGEEAIDHLETNQVDLLILDMLMEPGMDGLETYKEIIKKHPKQKTIIASGYSETSRVKEAQKLGVGEYIKKPYTMEKIGIAVKTELNR
jgi:PAS domain S-box-containing protein